MNETKQSKWNRLKEIFHVWRLKRKADKLARETEDQHFVVKWQGEVRIISKKGFKQMKRRGIFGLSFTATELKKHALYYTK
ncbi:hypothetical protein [Dysgonomonas sp. 520]|uniref:hypothetical protein n=1 Tax=Dysgonomonas sp. 520 TaxID=2302931 RepID=UPI0013D0E62A|nr:hypothetical protein [Dysgonomonas sp. 520]NDW10461.1 hypothetical protein [Dysgonomonas sp. 520]